MTLGRCNYMKRSGRTFLLRCLDRRPHLIARYDGQTADDERPAIRTQARVILTNPEMLHLAVLAWHERHWQRFLTKLRYIILHEAHDYRGTYGSNVAMLMRRLLLVCGRYGSAPQFIATSATIAAAGPLRRISDPPRVAISAPSARSDCASHQRAAPPGARAAASSSA